MRISGIRALSVKTPSDAWAWVRVETDAGMIGWGEFSGSPISNHSAGAVINYLAGDLLNGDPLCTADCLGDIRAWRYPSPLDNRAIAIAVSALDMALWDIRAQAEGVPLFKLLGAERTHGISLYANLNRLLRRDRSLERLVSAAEAAVSSGFQIVKIAPFDEVLPSDLASDVAQGLLRWREIERVIGRSRISIDCHCRFYLSSFTSLIDSLGPRAEEALFWEDPVRIHRACDVQPISASLPHLRLASGEDCFHADDLRQLARSKLLDVLNPDIKYIGGVTAARELIPELLPHGGNVCLHNPSGPIATAHSAHVSALCGPRTMLEFAFGDQAMRDAAIGGHEQIEKGCYRLSDEPGIGVSPSEEFLEQYASVIK